MDNLAAPSLDAVPSRPKLRTMAGSHQPVVFLKATEEHKEKYQEIMAIDNVEYATQALSIAALLNRAINISDGRFDSAKARQLIVDFNAALPPAELKYSLGIMNVYKSTVSQENAQVSGMIDKLLDVLKNALGVALGAGSIEQIKSAITDAFTNLKSQDGDAWIFWQKKEAKKTVYSYALLFAIQDETTGRVMLAFPMSLDIEVNVQFEQVLWIKVTDIHTYSVTVDAMKIAQLLHPSSPGSLAMRQVLAAGDPEPVNTPAGEEIVTAPVPISHVEVKNWAGTVTFALAQTGTLVQDAGLTQIVAINPVIWAPVYDEGRYMVHYRLNGHSHQIPMILNAVMGADLWFVSQ